MLTDSLFNTPNKQDYNLHLYTNFNAVCGQKVEFLLRHSSLEFTSSSLNLRAGDQTKDWFVALNPKGQVPVLKHHEEIVTESNQILLYLDDKFLDFEYTELINKKKPYQSKELIHHWLNWIDRSIHNACSIVSWSIAIRPAMEAKTDEEREAHFAAIPDTARRERQERAYQLGYQLPELTAALSEHRKLLSAMDEQLEESDWLAGDRITLADFCVIPYIVRLKYLAFDPLLVRHKNVHRWLESISGQKGFHQVFQTNYPDGFIRQWQAYGKDALQELEI